MDPVVRLFLTGAVSKVKHEFPFLFTKVVYSCIPYLYLKLICGSGFVVFDYWTNWTQCHRPHFLPICLKSASKCVVRSLHFYYIFEDAGATGFLLLENQVNDAQCFTRGSIQRDILRVLTLQVTPNSNIVACLIQFGAFKETKVRNSHYSPL